MECGKCGYVPLPPRNCANCGEDNCMTNKLHEEMIEVQLGAARLWLVLPGKEGDVFDRAVDEITRLRRKVEMGDALVKAYTTWRESYREDLQEPTRYALFLALNEAVRAYEDCDA